MLKLELIKAIRSTGHFGENGEWLKPRPGNEFGEPGDSVEAMAERICESYNGQDDLKEMVDSVIDHEFEIDFHVDDFFGELKRPKEYREIAKKCLIVMIKWHSDQGVRHRERQT